MYTKTKKSISMFLILSMILTIFVSSFSVSASTEPVAPQIKNIIFMIPDGGAMAPFYLADAVKQAGGFDKTKYPNATPVEKGEMYLKDFLVGAETTYSANNAVTDSAAGGTALSSGYKTNNGYIGIDPQKKPHANILEACQDMGKNTGIVVTYEWTNATPAAFSAHDISRYNMTTMSEQIVNQGIDVVFGNTHTDFSSTEWFTDSALSDRGYKIIKNRTALEKVKPGDRLWGKLPAAYYDINRKVTTPNLAELTNAAITALDDGNENGFFLMVEGRAVDGGGHSNNAVQMVSEYLAFDEACKVAIEFAKERTDTIVIIAPDHDTGGLSYDYSNKNAIVSDIQVGTNSSLVSWETDYHTARNGGVFMYLPEGVPYPTGIDLDKAEQVASDFYDTYGTFSSDYPSDAVNVINNIDIPAYISSLIGADLDTTTNKLFIDVTNQGTYDSTTEVFEFTDRDISIKRNASTASIKGIPVDLDGEVALYIEGKFYVPQKLIDMNDHEFTGEALLIADYNTGDLKYSGNVGIANAYVSTMIVKPGSILNNKIAPEEIAAIKQSKTDIYGGYSFNMTVERIAGEYNVYTNYLGGTSTPISNSFALKNTIPTLTVKKGEADIENISQLTSGDSLNITLGGFDLEDDYPGLVIIGQYVDGVLTSAEYIPVSGGSAYFGDEIKKNTTVISNADKIIICYWNKNTYMPLIASYTID